MNIIFMTREYIYRHHTLKRKTGRNKGTTALYPKGQVIIMGAPQSSALARVLNMWWVPFYGPSKWTSSMILMDPGVWHPSE